MESNLRPDAVAYNRNNNLRSEILEFDRSENLKYLLSDVNLNPIVALLRYLYIRTYLNIKSKARGSYKVQICSYFTYFFFL